MLLLTGEYHHVDYGSFLSYLSHGVNYGPIRKDSTSSPWYLGDVNFSQMHNIGEIGTSEEIAEVLRREGFWMWKRPDRSVLPRERASACPHVYNYPVIRFPIDSSPTFDPAPNIPITLPAKLTPSEPISRLPLEILQSIALHVYLSLSDIITLAMLNKEC